MRRVRGGNYEELALIAIRHNLFNFINISTTFVFSRIAYYYNFFLGSS